MKGSTTIDGKKGQVARYYKGDGNHAFRFVHFDPSSSRMLHLNKDRKWVNRSGMLSDDYLWDTHEELMDFLNVPEVKVLRLRMHSRMY